MALGLVWGERIFPVAGIKNLQNACAGVVVALPGVSPCPKCKGRRLGPESLLYRITVPEDLIPSKRRERIGPLNLADFYGLPVSQALAVARHWRQRCMRSTANRCGSRCARFRRA